MIPQKPKDPVCHYCKHALGKTAARLVIANGWACAECGYRIDRGEPPLTPEEREALAKEARKRGARVKQERLFEPQPR